MGNPKYKEMYIGFSLEIFDAKLNTIKVIIMKLLWSFCFMIYCFLNSFLKGNFKCDYGDYVVAKIVKGNPK